MEELSASFELYLERARADAARDAQYFHYLLLANEMTQRLDRVGSGSIQAVVLSMINDAMEFNPYIDHNHGGRAVVVDEQ